MTLRLEVPLGNKRTETQPDVLAVRVERRIYLIRRQNVMLGHDLAELYGVPTGQLNRAVQRNARRFPEDFMFRLTRKEDDDLKCQLGISSQYGGRRYLPYAFTEQDEKFALVFDAIRELMDEGEKRRRRPAIGYHTEAMPTARKKAKRAKP